jgi:hypothetical protein
VVFLILHLDIGFSAPNRSFMGVSSAATNTSQDFKLCHIEYLSGSNTALRIQAGSKVPKPIPASAPMAVRFEVGCLCGFRGTSIVPFDS